MFPPVIAPIVEGHGEMESIRPLVYTVLAHSQSEIYPRIARPIRAPRNLLIKEVEHYAEIAIRESGSASKLIVLLDADDDCPAELGPELSERLNSRFPSHAFSVSLANREYETWFIASLESIAEPAGLDPSANLPSGGAESIWSIRCPSRLPIFTPAGIPLLRTVRRLRGWRQPILF